jgi:hypothetical protein
MTTDSDLERTRKLAERLERHYRGFDRPLFVLTQMEREEARENPPFTWRDRLLALNPFFEKLGNRYARLAIISVVSYAEGMLLMRIGVVSDNLLVCWLSLAPLAASIGIMALVTLAIWLESAWRVWAALRA